MNQLEKWECEMFGLENISGVECISFRFRLGTGTLLTMCVDKNNISIESDTLHILLQRILPSRKENTNEPNQI